MTFRDFLDGILDFIGAESLTDNEFNSFPSETEIQNYSQENYDFLANVLEDRDAVSTTQDRLVAYFKAKGVDVTANDTAKSEIYLGSVLE